MASPLPSNLRRLADRHFGSVQQATTAASRGADIIAPAFGANIISKR
jgi:hypothetical protein